MKKIYLLLLVAISSNAFSAGVEGAWKAQDSGKEIILLFKDGYFTFTAYTPNTFLSAWGGTYKVEGNTINIVSEFNSADSSHVGNSHLFNLSINGKQLSFNVTGKPILYKRLDEGSAPLAGVWKISDREQGGQLVAIHQTGTRKTLKILTGTRFQWFAINPGTKEFSGTGGGMYSFMNGKYTENIGFFSRDNSRVGAELTFDGKLEDGKWHHSGLSSKGDKIYEVWTRVNP